MTLYVFHCATVQNHKLLVPTKTVPEAAKPLSKVGWVFERQLGANVKPNDILDVLLAVGDPNVVHENIKQQGYHAVHAKWHLDALRKLDASGGLRST
jgi:hypothetical protein